MVSYTVGLDLGQQKDYSALCVAERERVAVAIPDDGPAEDCRHCGRRAWKPLAGGGWGCTGYGCGWRHEPREEPADRLKVTWLQRYPLGTSYPAIVGDVGRLMHTLKARAPKEYPTLAIDGTGVGRPVVDLFRKDQLPCHLRPIVITAGHAEGWDAGYTLVPKRDLVGQVQALLQGRRLEVAKALPDAKTLTKELTTFQVKITDAANDVYGAWREGQHDDLVLATALAAWAALRPRTVQFL